MLADEEEGSFSVTLLLVLPKSSKILGIGGFAGLLLAAAAARSMLFVRRLAESSSAAAPIAALKGLEAATLELSWRMVANVAASMFEGKAAGDDTGGAAAALP